MVEQQKKYMCKQKSKVKTKRYKNKNIWSDMVGNLHAVLTGNTNKWLRAYLFVNISFSYMFNRYCSLFFIFIGKFFFISTMTWLDDKPHNKCYRMIKTRSALGVQIQKINWSFLRPQFIFMLLCFCITRNEIYLF